MSADNYYYVMHHPIGGFTTIMRWMSDERPVRKVAPEDPRFLSFEKAYAYGATLYSEYGVRVSDEVLAEISGREYRKVDDGAGAFADELLAAREEFAEYVAKKVAKMVANLK